MSETRVNEAFMVGNEVFLVGRIVEGPIRTEDGLVHFLFESHQNGTAELSQEYILDRIGSEGDTLTLRDVFRNSPAWRTLVVQGSRRGMYRLNL